MKTPVELPFNAAFSGFHQAFRIHSRIGDVIDDAVIARHLPFKTELPGSAGARSSEVRLSEKERGSSNALPNSAGVVGTACRLALRSRR